MGGEGGGGNFNIVLHMYVDENLQKSSQDKLAKKLWNHPQILYNQVCLNHELLGLGEATRGAGGGGST